MESEVLIVKSALRDWFCRVLHQIVAVSKNSPGAGYVLGTTQGAVRRTSDNAKTEYKVSTLISFYCWKTLQEAQLLHRNSTTP